MNLINKSKEWLLHSTYPIESILSEINYWYIIIPIFVLGALTTFFNLYANADAMRDLFKITYPLIIVLVIFESLIITCLSLCFSILVEAVAIHLANKTQNIKLGFKEVLKIVIFSQSVSIINGVLLLMESITVFLINLAFKQNHFPQYILAGFVSLISLPIIVVHYYIIYKALKEKTGEIVNKVLISTLAPLFISIFLIIPISVIFGFILALSFNAILSK